MCDPKPGGWPCRGAISGFSLVSKAFCSQSTPMAFSLECRGPPFPAFVHCPPFIATNNAKATRRTSCCEDTGTASDVRRHVLGQRRKCSAHVDKHTNQQPMIFLISNACVFLFYFQIWNPLFHQNFQIRQTNMQKAKKKQKPSARSKAYGMNTTWAVC